MGALVVLVLSIAALDSINPSTVAPAVILALGERPARRLASFTAGVFLVSVTGGLVALFAVGRSVVTRIAHPTPHTRHVLEVALAIGILVVAALLWTLRKGVRMRLSGASGWSGRSALLVGAGIMAVELPTAFPYFAAILATLGATHSAIRQAALVVLYNLVFVAPLLALTVFVAATGTRRRRWVGRVATAVDRWAPDVLPIGLAVIGAALLAIGVRSL